MSALWVVMPVYNERASIKGVIDEWLPALRAHAPGFKLLVLNDGSRDDTLEILRTLEKSVPELCVVDKPNSGHGQTCVEGYRRALQEGAEWIFQIDSDGQCDPAYFAAVWAERQKGRVVYGYRRRREDGRVRFAISRVVSIVTFLGTGNWVRDANVPYRLMHRSTLEDLVPLVPPDFYLANILLAALQQKRFGIRWIDIVFRQRAGGVPSLKPYSFVREGAKLLRQLWSRPAGRPASPAADSGASSDRSSMGRG